VCLDPSQGCRKKKESCAENPSGTHNQRDTTRSPEKSSGISATEGRPDAALVTMLQGNNKDDEHDADEDKESCEKPDEHTI
jgi:hypothetical protein